MREISHIRADHGETAPPENNLYAELIQIILGLNPEQFTQFFIKVNFFPGKMHP